MPALEGKTLGRYEVRKLVGRGGMADVYEGYDPRFERVVAIKVFKREDEQMLRRFIREAHLMASLSNPHLVPIYDAGSEQSGESTWSYIVMPFMEGGTLRAHIRRSPLPLAEACQDISAIASALDYIHSQGIIHRDIKSSNVLLNAEGKCFLSDFGIAHTATDATQLTSTGNILGTVDYIAPELFEPHRKADTSSDLYALGVLLFEMVTGQLPFTSEHQIALVAMHMHQPPPSPRSFSQQISPQVEQVIFKALEKKPEDRYPGATELANAFCQAVTASISTMTPIAGQRQQASAGSAMPRIEVSQRKRLILPPVATETPNFQATPLGDAVENFVVPPARTPPPFTPSAKPTSPPRQSAQPIYPAQRRRANGHRWVLAILSVIAVLAVTIPGIYAITHPGSGNRPGTTSSGGQTRAGNTTTAQSHTPSPLVTPNLTATTQAIAAATSTAQAHSTAAAIAGLTATAQAHASATAGVILTATSGQPIYIDALNNANNSATIAARWAGLDGTDSQCSFAANGYHVKQGSGVLNLHGCQETGNSYGNGTLSLDVTLLSGHSAGLFFRLHTDPLGNYYGDLFEIDSSGNYKLSSYNNTTLQNWTTSSALKAGYGVKNTLQVIMNGSNLSFYANGAFLVAVTDTAYTTGNLAVMASANNTSTEAVYSNLKVYSQGK